MLKLIPQPQKIEKISDKTFSFTNIKLGTSDLSVEAQEEFISSCSLPFSKSETIIFKTNTALSDEEYIIETGNEITIFFKFHLRTVICTSNNKTNPFPV